MKVIIGSDEVGRGCFAGPIVAAAVILDTRKDIEIFRGKDSKKLTPQIREELSARIKESHRFAFGVVEVQEIDFLGMTLANQLAIIRAVENLNIEGEIILVDGNLKFQKANYFSIVKGDSFAPSISAASIIAKVYRDKIMQELHELFPIYGWHSNKGYGTLEHRKAILTHGTTAHHRKSFKLQGCHCLN